MLYMVVYVILMIISVRNLNTIIIIIIIIIIQMFIQVWHFRKYTSVINVLPEY